MKSQFELCIEIGEIPILVRTDSAEFASLLQDRYGKFVVGWRAAGDPASEAPARGGKQAMRNDAERRSEPPSAACLVSNFQFPVSAFELEVELLPPGLMSDAEDARVRLEGGRWVMERGDFRAECDPVRRRGWVRQSANPYSIDAVLRMLHSLLLARDGGFLVHAASAVRNGRAFLFAGVSGAGKTTISRLAPPDVVLLTDEISYVRGFRIQESGVRRQKSEIQNRMRPLARHLPASWRALGRICGRQSLRCTCLARAVTTPSRTLGRPRPCGRCSRTSSSLPRMTSWRSWCSRPPSNS